MLVLPSLTKLSGLEVKFEPDKITPPSACPHQDCHHPYLRLHQIVTKRLRDFDPAYSQLTAFRYQCRRCKRTFRVYPEGAVKRQQASCRVKKLAVTLYLLNLSYQAVYTILKELGVTFSKSWVYQVVQAVAERLQELDPTSKEHHEAGIEEATFPKVAKLAIELVNVKCVGRKLLLGITLDAQTGTILTVFVKGNIDLLMI